MYIYNDVMSPKVSIGWVFIVDRIHKLGIFSHAFRGIPYIGPWIQAPFSEYLENQKRRLHRRPGEKVVQVSGRKMCR